MVTEFFSNNGICLIMRLTIRLYWDFICIELCGPRHGRDHGDYGEVGTTARQGPRQGRDHGKTGERKGSEAIELLLVYLHQHVNQQMHINNECH